MRVTYTSSFTEGVADLTLASQRLADAQRAVSSGQRIASPSDDPSGTAAAITDRATLGAIDTYTKSTDAATSRLTVADSVMSDIINKLSAAQTSALGARGTTQTQSQRDAAAADLQGISDALLADFTTQYRGAYLFSGAKTTVAPYTKAGGVVSAYQGDSTTVSVDIDQGRTLQVSLDGGAIAQGSDPADIFSTLSSLITAVKTGDNTGIGNGMAALDRAFSRATLAQTTVGTGLSLLDDQRARLSTVKVDATARLSKVEDADMAESITNMNQADTSYRAALGAFATVGRVSLLDYLK